MNRKSFLWLSAAALAAYTLPAASQESPAPAQTQSRFMPLFPLEVIVFPGQRIPFHIFEPRYKQLFAECEADGIHFGIPPHFGGRVATYGTEMKLVEVLKRYDSGELDLITEAVGAFHIDEFQSKVPDKLYSGAMVTPILNDPTEDPDARRRLVRAFNRYHRRIGDNATAPETEVESLSFALAEYVGFDVDQAVHLLSLGKETDRQNYITAHLDAALLMLDQTDPDTTVS